MGSQRHDRITELFLRACALDSAAREAFLDEACAGNAELRAEVDSLLAHDGSRLLETGAGASRVAEVIRDQFVNVNESISERVCDTCGASIPEDQIDCAVCRTQCAEDEPQIPGYEILHVLGAGGMGKVYLARDITLDRRVAIKTVSETLGTDRRAGLRFVREARAMAAVEHPNIARVYTFGQAEGRHYLVMEYVEGESLARRIRREGSLELAEALTILRQITQALAAAWEHEIIHRDVKPANILMDIQGNVRVVDFGLAKAVEAAGDPGLTRDGHVLGTAHYLSPEQARGSRETDFRTDVYSLGIVLFEMLTGTTPFRGETPISIIDQHIHSPLPSLRSGRPELAGEVEQLCEWMARKLPADRPGSYRVLLDSIDALSGDAPAAGMTPGSLPAFLAPSDEEEAAEPSVFVGREQELADLDGTLQKTLAGEGRVVLVTGEAGTGKTALVARFARCAQEAQADLVVARGNCNAQTGIGDPYLPFREVLALLTGDVEARRTSGALGLEHARRLWSLMPLAAQALVDAGPDLVGTFVSGTLLVSRAAAFTPSPAGWRVRLEELARRNADTPRDVALQQSYLFEQYTKTLLTLARHHPLLLVLEDLQWADAGSCSLLFHLARRIAGSRILVVGTYRPAEVLTGRDAQRHPLEPVINELKLGFGDLELRLAQEGTREFIEALVDGEPNRLSAEFRDALYRQTRGHPLFAVELLRSMREQGILARDDTGRWLARRELDWETLPVRLEGAIGERIGRLPEPLREMLTLASVEGEEFTAEILAEVRGSGKRETVGLLSGELDKRHRLVSAQGVRRMNGRRLSVYRFRHILFQKYLYGQLDEAERAYAHEDVAGALEKVYGERVRDIAPRLAHHFSEAGVPGKTIHYLREAGDRAVRLSANEEARAHFARALELVEAQPDSPETAREELALRLAQGAPLLATAGPGSDELSRAYTRAHELCERVGQAPQLFQTLFILVHHHAAKGELATALEMAEQLLQVVERAAEPLPDVMAYWARGFVFHYLGRFAEAREDHERVVELYDAKQHASLAYVFGMDPAVSALSFNSEASWCLGFPDRAEQCSRRALALARGLEHPSSLAHALTVACALAIHCRDVELLQEQTDALLRLSTEKGVVLFQAWATFLEGWLLVEKARAREGLARIREGLKAMKAAGSKLALPFVLGKLAEANGKSGEVETGLSLVAEAISGVQQTGERIFEAELHRIEGELLLGRSQGCGAQAERCFRKSIEIARSQSAKSWELRAATSLSRLLESQNRRAEARQLLADAQGQFTEGLDTRDLKDAAALLSRLS